MWVFWHNFCPTEAAKYTCAEWVHIPASSLSIQSAKCLLPTHTLNPSRVNKNSMNHVSQELFLTVRDSGKLVMGWIPTPSPHCQTPVLFIRQYLRTCLHLEKGKDEVERVNANPMGLLLYSEHWDGTVKERGIRRSQTGCHVDHVGLELVAFLGKFISGV